MANKKRKLYIDLIKIVAIYMVLFNHTGQDGFMLFAARRDSAFYWFYLCNAVFIKVAVPLFFMSSGALMLDRDYEFKDIIRKFLRFLFILVAASFLSYLYECYRLHNLEFSIRYFFETIYQEPMALALWYLYAYLAYILMLPVLRFMAKSMDDKTYIWMFIMYGMVMSLPIVEFIIWKGEGTHYDKFYLFITNSYVFYPLMGYFIDKRIKPYKKQLFVMTVLSTCSIAIIAIMTNWRCVELDIWKGKIDTFFGTLLFIPTITMFYCAKYYFESHAVPDRIGKIISLISSGTFGLFLIENICREETYWIFRIFNNKIPTILASWIWVFAACALGITITLLIKKIPGVSRYI